MKQLYFAILSFGTLGSLAHADQRSDPFRALLAHVQVSFLGPVTDRWEVEFADLHAAAAAISAPPAETNPVYGSSAGPLIRGHLPTFGDNVSPDLLAAWPGLLGFDAAQIGAMVSVTHLPDSALILQLDPGTGAGVAPVLLANGYTQTDTAGYPALFRGVEDRAFDLRARNPADPFGGALGKSSRIGMQGDVVLQSSSWPLLSAMMAPDGQVLADQPEMAALLAALDTAPATLGGLVRVHLLNDPTALGVFDPLAGLTFDPPPEGQVIAAPPEGGLPFWSLGLIADLATPGTETAFVALIYPTQAIADTAAARLQSGWQDLPTQTSGQSFQTLIGAPAVTSVTGSGPFVVVLTITVPAKAQRGIINNRPYSALMQAAARRDLQLLAPQMP